MPDTIVLGGDLPVRRLGYGALRLPFRPAAARGMSLQVLRRAVELGVTFIDTADSYDYGANEEMIAEALHPYPDGVVIATKAGHARPSESEWVPLGRPEYLLQQAELSLRRLRLDRIDLFQLHRVDPAVPLADQVGALRRLQDEGKVRHVGLSEVTAEQIAEAATITPIVSVQNLYNLHDRRHDEALAYCERRGMAFIPWLPIARTVGNQPDGAVTAAARRLGATPAQVALAWLLHRSPAMLPIPGTASAVHLAENVAAVDLALTPDEVDRLTG